MAKVVKETLDLTAMGVGDLVREMSEAAVQQRYWDSLGDGAGDHGFKQQAAWRKHTERVQQELNRRFVERK